METNIKRSTDFWMFLVFIGTLLTINVILFGTGKLAFGAEGLGVMIAAALTLCFYSFLYKDNPLYKFAEHFYVGVATAYYLIADWYNVILPDVGIASKNLLSEGLMVDGNLWKFTLILIPTFLGLLVYTRLLGEIGWMSRITFAVVIGYGMGLSIPIMINAKLLKQIEASMLPLWTSAGIDFGALVIFIGVLSTLVYFFFSVEHKGFIGWTARVGIVFLMVSFGASFGFTVMARISLLIERVNFLFTSWIPLIPT